MCNLENRVKAGKLTVYSYCTLLLHYISVALVQDFTGCFFESSLSGPVCGTSKELATLFDVSKADKKFRYVVLVSYPRFR